MTIIDWLLVIAFFGTPVVAVLCHAVYHAGLRRGRGTGWRDAAGFAAGVAETATLPPGVQHADAEAAHLFRRGAERAAACIREIL